MSPTYAYSTPRYASTTGEERAEERGSESKRDKEKVKRGSDGKGKERKSQSVKARAKASITMVFDID